MKIPALLSAAILLFGCAPSATPSAQVTEGAHRGYTKAPKGCPGGRKAGEVWCAACWIVAGEPQFKQVICEDGLIRDHGPCTTEAVCRAPAPAASDARANLVIYQIDAPDRGCQQPGKGDKAVMLLNRSAERALIATVRSAQSGPQEIAVPPAQQLRLGCAAEGDQPTDWTLVDAAWAP